MNDITKVACLMQTDGFTYRFIHKSVAEFHAACFIARVSDENARKFYDALKGGRCVSWRQELRFLSHIDRLRFLKFFYIPSVQRLKSYGIDIMHGGAIDDATARRVLNSIHLQGAEGDLRFSIVGHGVVLDEVVSAVARAVAEDSGRIGRAWRGSRWGHQELGNHLADRGELEVGKQAMLLVYSKVKLQVTNAQREIELASGDGDFIAP